MDRDIIAGILNAVKNLKERSFAVFKMTGWQRSWVKGRFVNRPYELGVLAIKKHIKNQQKYIVYTKGVCYHEYYSFSYKHICAYITDKEVEPWVRKSS
ncbi:MAG: hypothetical protein K0R93_3746 [Anaerosolibacter sp.]|nr:hypothetical protein [Anaerosolibacter sp.]